MNKKFFFIKFSIIFSIIYFLILNFFPNYEMELIFITLLFLAETHFVATWPFFFAKSNIDYIRNNYEKLLLLPIAIIFF